MDILWAPWRTKYISLKKTTGCVFCKSLKSKEKNHVVFRSALSFCILNAFPYNNGHIMVCPIKHTRDLSYLNDEEIMDLLKSVNIAKKLLDKTLKPHGYNIGMNISQTAGAGITGHIHIHIVPRFKGDTNFMPAVYNTKIISQSLDELLKKLKKQHMSKLRRRGERKHGKK